MAWGHRFTPTFNNEVFDRKWKNCKGKNKSENCPRRLRDQLENFTQEGYANNLKILPRYKLRKKEINTIVGNGDFDPRPHDESRVEPRCETVPWKIGNLGQDMEINLNLDEEEKQKII